AMRFVSPAAMAPPSGRVVLISGALDRLVPPYAAFDYEKAMRNAAGLKVETATVDGAGHFDLVMAATPAWRAVRKAIEDGLRRRP
ncbi:MAG TPA: alpha/beta hydrolase, partial [Burkholderiaceae bacterium]